MSDNQRFPVATHALAYLAYERAFSPEAAVSSAALAASMPTNAVVVRRVTSLLAKAGLIGTRAGASGGAWLLAAPEDIGLDKVLRAVHGCAQLGSPPPGAKGCPIGEKISIAIQAALDSASNAAAGELAKTTLGDLIKDAMGSADAA